MTMSNTQQKPLAQQPAAQQQVRKPNEKGNVTVQAYMKIFDPKTKQVYVEGRA